MGNAFHKNKFLEAALYEIKRAKLPQNVQIKIGDYPQVHSKMENGIIHVYVPNDSRLYDARTPKGGLMYYLDGDELGFLIFTADIYGLKYERERAEAVLAMLERYQNKILEQVKLYDKWENLEIKKDDAVRRINNLFITKKKMVEAWRENVVHRKSTHPLIGRDSPELTLAELTRISKNDLHDMMQGVEVVDSPNSTLFDNIPEFAFVNFDAGIEDEKYTDLMRKIKTTIDARNQVQALEKSLDGLYENEMVKEGLSNGKYDFDKLRKDMHGPKQTPGDDLVENAIRILAYYAGPNTVGSTKKNWSDRIASLDNVLPVTLDVTDIGKYGSKYIFRRFIELMYRQNAGPTIGPQKVGGLGLGGCHGALLWPILIVMVLICILIFMLYNSKVYVAVYSVTLLVSCAVLWYVVG